MNIRTFAASQSYSGRVGRYPRGRDLLGHRFDLSKGAAREEEVRPLASEGTRDRAADGSSPSVDYGVLVLKQYSHRLLSVELSLVRDVAQRDSSQGSCSSDMHCGATSPRAAGRRGFL